MKRVIIIFMVFIGVSLYGVPVPAGVYLHAFPDKPHVQITGESIVYRDFIPNRQASQIVINPMIYYYEDTHEATFILSMAFRYSQRLFTPINYEFLGMIEQSQVYRGYPLDFRHTVNGDFYTIVEIWSYEFTPEDYSKLDLVYMVGSREGMEVILEADAGNISSLLRTFKSYLASIDRNMDDLFIRGQRPELD